MGEMAGREEREVIATVAVAIVAVETAAAGIRRETRAARRAARVCI